MKPASCHPQRRLHSRGLCRPCWDAKYRQPANCHPLRQHVALGLCRKCYNDLPENKQRQELTRRAKKYGMTPDQVLDLERRACGRCELCEDPFPNGLFSAHIDHDHVTGKVRGLLCHRCNIGLGHFLDDSRRLAMAIQYLEAHRGTHP